MLAVGGAVINSHRRSSVGGGRTGGLRDDDEALSPLGTKKEINVVAAAPISLVLNAWAQQ